MLNFTINWIQKFQNRHQEINSIYVADDDGGRLNTAIPEYKSLPKLLEIDGHTLIDDKLREEYFQEILNEDVRIKMINGVEPVFEFSCIFCDYCGTNILDYNGLKPYYYCWDCHNDMCNMCFHETSSEIAKANGAKNYEKRQEQLSKCRKHKLLSRNIPEFDDVEDASDEILSKVWQDLEIGSILDWIPVYQDSESHDMVLLNCNKKSNLCGRIVLMANDNHGRNGYYTLPVDWTLDRVHRTLENYSKNPLKYDDDGEELSGWGIFYNLPIKRIMANLNMPIHYG